MSIPMQVPSAMPVRVPAIQVPQAVPLPSPAVVTQPQSQVVVNVQNAHQVPFSNQYPFPGPVDIGPISWSTGLMSCFDDIPVCLLGTFCPFVLPCYLSSLYGEVCCLGFLPGAMFAMRTGMRERYRIPGNLLNDYCAICCCSSCSLCQMVREVKNRNHTGLPESQAHFHLHVNRNRK